MNPTATSPAVPAANPAWDRVAKLRPRLREGLRVHVHRYRGEPWYVVEDPVSNRFHRFDASTYALVCLLDGERSIGEALEGMSAPLHKGEVVSLVARLSAAELLASGLPPSTEALLEKVQRLSRARLQRGLLSPLSVRVPLLDPEAFLARTEKAVRPLFSIAGLVAWLLAVIAATVLAAEHWDALVLHFDTRAMDPSNVAMLWVIYPLLKAVHELGHGYAVKRWGGTVHEMGVVLLVFTPVPYVDATSSTAFADKRQRMLVAGAGIMVELALAAVAMVAWLHLAPGLWRDAAFNVMLIGVGSTLLFNGNPLLRFDGYHVLADALEIPNLGTRSSNYLAYLGKRWVLGVADVPAPATAAGERGWLIGYGVASLFYRTVVLFTIALYIAGRMFFIGVVLALWVVAAQLVLPLVRLLSYLASGASLQGQRGRAVASVAGLAVMLLVGLTLVPVGSATHAEGVVEVPPGSEVRAGTDGIVAQVLVADGQSVSPGEPLVILDDPLLPAEVKRLEWRVRELERRRDRASLEERVKKQMADDELERARAALDDAKARLERLVVRSTASGTVSIDGADNLPGRFARRGDLLVRVRRAADATARVVVTQADAARVRGDTRELAVRLASLPGVSLPARLVRELPAATDRLPDASLGTGGGGRIHVDARDKSGRKSLERVFQFEVALPGSAHAYRPGTRAHVRFRHGAEPLATQWYHQLRNLFRARFEV